MDPSFFSDPDLKFAPPNSDQDPTLINYVGLKNLVKPFKFIGTLLKSSPTRNFFGLSFFFLGQRFIRHRVRYLNFSMIPSS